jgi:hypothetical protein
MGIMSPSDAILSTLTLDPHSRFPQIKVNNYETELKPQRKNRLSFRPVAGDLQRLLRTTIRYFIVIGRIALLTPKTLCLWCADAHRSFCTSIVPPHIIP